MGNLLGAPVTEKETHEGITKDERIPFAVTSMQGWRVHMEDAHICEPSLYAAEEEEEGQQQVKAGDNNPGGGAKNGNVQATASANNKYSKIPLPGHALFAVFDGHGGTFAAAYAGRNLCRVLSRQPKFVEYAKFERERPAKEPTLTSQADRNNYVRSGLELLEQALVDAFVDLDREIALALKGTKVHDADQPYNTDEDDELLTEVLGGAAAPGNDSATANSPSQQQQHENNSNSMDVDHNHPDDEPSPEDSALQLLEEEGDSGTTACVVVVTPGFVVCANAGDSRAVISRSGNKAVPLSYDHKPDDNEEENRIRAAGGYVAGGRVEGDLAVSRGLGDFRFKRMDVVLAGTSAYAGKNSGNSNNPDGAEGGGGEQQENSDRPQQHAMMQPGDQKVSPIPDIVVQARNELQDEFVLVACDGIWDVQTNYEAVQTVSEMFKEGETNLGLACEEVRQTRSFFHLRVSCF